MVLATCTGLSFLIEIGQVWFPPRVPSFADVVAQMLGTGVGCLIWWTAGSTISAWIGLYLEDTRPAGQVDWLLQAYLVGLVLYSVMPLDLTLSPTELFNKYEEAGKIVLVPFSYNYGSLRQLVFELGTDVVIFIPVGMLAASLLTSSYAPVRSMASSLAFGFAIVLAIELVQLLVLSRFTDTTDLITGTLGVAIGAWLMRRWRGARRVANPSHAAPKKRPSIVWKWFFAAIAYAALLVLLFWAPFDFTLEKEAAKQRLDGFFALPFSSALRGSRFGSLNVLLRKVLLFVPLGVLLSLSVQSLPRHFRRVALTVLLIAAWGFALAIELGQIVLPDRVAVFDDTLLCALGACVGALATERILSRRPGADRTLAETE
jgi:glycopeptide antibiotics resistance protein